MTQVVAICRDIHEPHIVKTLNSEGSYLLEKEPPRGARTGVHSAARLVAVDSEALWQLPVTAAGLWAVRPGY